MSISAGDKFGKWTVVHVPQGLKAHCICDCGAQKEVFRGHLRAGNSLGCARCRKNKKGPKHGMYDTATYGTWASMKYRCHQNHKDFALYAGKGIAVCEKWLEFKGFFEDMGIRPDGCSIDRIDGNLGYFKENCRWATAAEQANNISTNRHVQFEGKDYTCAELAAHLGIKYHAMYARIVRGHKLDAPMRNSQP